MQSAFVSFYVSYSRRQTKRVRFAWPYRTQEAVSLDRNVSRNVLKKLSVLTLTHNGANLAVRYRAVSLEAPYRSRFARPHRTQEALRGSDQDVPVSYSRSFPQTERIRTCQPVEAVLLSRKKGVSYELSRSVTATDLAVLVSYVPIDRNRDEGARVELLEGIELGGD